MNIYISENIRRLRRERDLTQERLAEHLGVTTSAVSKWERGEAYPDIGLILPLAGYFGVTTDELLGVDKARDEARIEAYLAEYHRLSSIGRDTEKWALIDALYDEFPNDWRVIDLYSGRLMWELLPGDEDGWQCLRDNQDKIIALCKRGIEECPDIGMRLEFAQSLAICYSATDRREDAIAVVRKHLPENPRCTQAETLANWVLESGSPEQVKLKRTIHNDHAYEIIWRIRHRADSEKGLARIRLLDKALQFAEIFWDDGDYGSAAWDLGTIACDIGLHYYRLGDTENALNYFERGFELSRYYDELWSVGVFTHTSALVAGVEWQPQRINTSDQLNRVGSELEYTKQYGVTDERILSLFERYREYAGTRK
ncbi:MAG: helix-turn-helix domain-containing protein [Oscillospiraceae bacterium]|jgi:transcriptional regulator with XRE-family HTH domain|nr:helix-turn-helix domain-containing protein [Oscillospiraceae bacterium]